MDAEPISVADLIAELELQLSPLIESACAQCVIENTSNSTLCANRMGLVTAMLNICNNAIEHVGPQLQLSVCVQDRANNISIDITDNGQGIPQEMRQRVFQPFFTTRSDGTGLGLPVVQSIVKAHRGQIEILEPIGGGTTFSITLPAHAQSPARSARVNAAA